MARIWQSGWELNSVTTDVEWSNVTGGAAATVQTGTVRTGTYAGRTNPAASTAFFRYHLFAADQSTVGYVRVYLRIATLPGANTTVLRILNAANNQTAQIRLTAAGTLILLDAGGTPVGSPSAALSTGVWYRLELKCDASSSPGSVEGRIDGSSFASGANSVQSPWSRVLFGPVVTATCDLFWDDAAFNDSSGGNQNGYPGEGKVIHLIPDSAGDSNAWNNTANGAGSSSNFNLVDEVPPNDTTDLVQTGTLNAEDSYNLTASGIGSGDTVNVVMVGGRHRNNTADATTAFRYQVRKTSGGTTTQSASIIPNSTTFVSNAGAQPRNYPIILYADPDTAAWTQATLDTMQIGVKLTAANVNRVQVSTVWASVDYTPSTGQTISPSSIGSGEAFGTAALSLDVSPSAVASAEAFGTPAVGLGVAPAGIASAEAHGTARVDLGVAPSGIATAEAFGTATVSQAGADTIAPAGIASAQAFGTALLELGVAPAGIGSGEQHGTATLTLGVTPAGIGTTEAFGVPSVTAAAVITVPSIASAETFGTPNLTGGAGPPLPDLTGALTVGGLSGALTADQLTGTLTHAGDLTGGLALLGLTGTLVRR